MRVTACITSFHVKTDRPESFQVSMFSNNLFEPKINEKKETPISNLSDPDRWAFYITLMEMNSALFNALLTHVG